MKKRRRFLKKITAYSCSGSSFLCSLDSNIDSLRRWWKELPSRRAIVEDIQKEVGIQLADMETIDGPVEQYNSQQESFSPIDIAQEDEARGAEDDANM